MVEIHPNVAEIYRKQIQQLHSLLDDESTRPEAMEIIRSMVDGIVVRAGGQRSKADVILEGALAQILAYPWNHESATRPT